MTSKCLSVVSSLVLWVLSTIIMKTKCGFKRHMELALDLKLLLVIANFPTKMSWPK